MEDFTAGNDRPSRYLPIKLIGWAMEQEIKPGPKLVLIYLSQHANEQTGLCNPSNATLARETGFSVSAVRGHLDYLVDNQLIERTRHRREDGSLGTYRYGFPSVRFWGHQGQILTLAPVSESGTRNKGSKPSNQERTTDVVLPDVSRVYDHWRKQRGKARGNYEKISSGRRQKIQARLKEFSVEELVDAIDGVAVDPWPDRALHDDLTVIFRSREQVEKFLALAEDGVSRGRSAKLTPYEIAHQFDHLIPEEKDAAPRNGPSGRSDSGDVPALEPIEGNSRRLPPASKRSGRGVGS